MTGPWPVSGAAIAVGGAALADRAWAASTTARLRQDCARMDDLALGRGWALVGGGELFRLYETPDANAAQQFLARHHIWSRIFPYSTRWMRMGLPGGGDEWPRVQAALAGGS